MPNHSAPYLESLPAISHRGSANYVTQSSLFDNVSTGPLTDRKIKKYQQAGRYGPEEKAKVTKQPKKKKSPGMKREELIKLLI